VIRDPLQFGNLTGTKYGAGSAQCGACTIMFGQCANASLCLTGGGLFKSGQKDKNHRRAFLKMATESLQKALMKLKHLNVANCQSGTNYARQQHYWKKSQSKVRAEIKIQK